MANPVSQFQLTDLFNMTNFNSKITDTNTYIETLVEEAKQSGVKIATGSYVGTGTYGADNPCSLTFDFEPKLCYVLKNNPFNFSSTGLIYLYSMLWITGVTNINPHYDSNSTNTFLHNGTNLSWYSTLPKYQFNIDGITYYYLAIG